MALSSLVMALSSRFLLALSDFRTLIWHLRARHPCRPRWCRACSRSAAFDRGSKHHMCVRAHTRTCTYAKPDNPQMRYYMKTHTRTCVRAHTQTHTRIHTHSLSPPPPELTHANVDRHKHAHTGSLAREHPLRAQTHMQAHTFAYGEQSILLRAHDHFSLRTIL